jgi:hypothetical protein
MQAGSDRGCGLASPGLFPAMLVQLVIVAEFGGIKRRAKMFATLS